MSFAGCAEVIAEPRTCLHRAGDTLTLWTRASTPLQLEIEPHGAARPVEVSQIEGGQQARVILPAGGARLVVATTGSQWALPLGGPRGEGGGSEQARALLRGGDVEAAITALVEASDAHLRSGRISRGVDDRQAAAYTALYRTFQYGRARALLEDARGRYGLYPRGRVVGDYFEGLLAMSTGDHRRALGRLEAAEVGAKRLGMPALRQGIMEMKAVTLARVGRGEAAAAAFDTEPSPAGPCDRARALTNQAWAALLMRRGDRRAGPDPRPPLVEALALYEGACPQRAKRPNVLLNLAMAMWLEGGIDWAWIWLQEALAEAPGGFPGGWGLDLEGRLLNARGLPRLAIRRFEALDAQGEAAGHLEMRLRAATGLGEALESMRRPDEAGEAYRRAERWLDDVVLSVPLEHDRALFLADHQRSSGRWVRLLLERGRHAEALEVARRARRRALVALEQADRLEGLPEAARAGWLEGLQRYRRLRADIARARAQDWTRSQAELDALARARAEVERGLRATLDEAFATLPTPREAPLASPAPGEVWLFYHPTPEGWVGFALEAGRPEPVARAVGEASYDPTDPARFAARWLMPFSGSLRGAERVRVFPSGPLHAVPFHLLPFDPEGGPTSAPLMAHAPVEYGLDLSPRAAAPARPGPALVVSDPSLDLRGARIEADAVARALGAAALPVEHLRGPEATSEAVSRGLGRASLLHYAGHGRADRGSPLAARLDLAGGGALSAADVLASGRPPPVVVLSGCGTGAVDPRGAGGGLSLTQAFLLAGAEVVIGAPELLDDEAARDLLPELYRAIEDQVGRPSRWAEALSAVWRARGRRALLDLRVWRR